MVLVWICVVYGGDQVAAVGLTSAWRRWGSGFSGQRSEKEPRVMSAKKKGNVDITAALILTLKWLVRVFEYFSAILCF